MRCASDCRFVNFVVMDGKGGLVACSLPLLRCEMERTFGDGSESNFCGGKGWTEFVG